MPDEDDDSLSLRFVLSVLERQLGHFDSCKNVSFTIDVDVVDCVDQVADFVRLGKSEFDSFSSQTKHTNCALWVLLSLGLSNNCCGVDLTIPSGWSEITIPVPF